MTKPEDSSRGEENRQSSDDEPGDAPINNETSGTAGAENHRPREIGGQPGPEPTRYGDWERNGRCTDF